MKRKLLLVATALCVCIIFATLFFTSKTYKRDPAITEPTDLADIIEFPSSATASSGTTCLVTLTDPLVNSIVGAGMASVVGLSEIMNELTAEGANFAAPPALLGGH